MRIDALTSYAAVLLAALSLTACASRELAQETGDPFEPTNRAIFAVNQTLDDAVIGPGARAYDAVTPDPVQTGVRNFMTNLNQPVVFANALLQGDVHAAGDTFGRFLMNTTIGVAGVFDVATHEGVPEHRRDFGQTLAHWGVGDGPYLVLPVIGPSNVRDATGRFVDRYPHPLNWNEEESGEAWAWGVRGLNGVQTRADLDDAIGSLNRTAIDPYVQARSAWRQSRRAFIQSQGETDEDYQDLPEFE
ncbi:MAG: VacJ-like lipoprotein [Oceanicaulis sp.]|jgi:phospholipid-binding lipoprotein MlaA|uniref:MlaA family lipoprotein n=1 Tax=unclassified Oceanicaulis TaxID=2632123 RepID=UPI000066D3BB|nr:MULTISPECIES: VacJ family lipoprotein [unclassified Oceanicaulis]EAP91614.1 VacJ-like lipoprotein [Oceanicaulis sp. HTCC2633]MAB69696.1 VacJ-like lipoprotein [Oceanicaulis sp.]MBG36044.1 VacJ-like lipoprotein [Oceanicaulis sp.]HBU61838.1 VacJ family lipoprotein [Oceanicaulis sp.]|tara:strand:- start:519 stop:1259 length:741 start_codon:yes stop_codon:yes gene_type:complete